mmetsp:Transcript_9213/g.18117  ORF Transcript_9213/g.18117 Transcript_9213/m.18117 type:complete len:253 (+) Transcript_9213:2635-3393(+)|eukprot:CAMPEP_0171500454 /NCGR_PEP_ID=MMETSP0958-20121227/8997_1 /TAXON_ID=87120 /ORGANISM="Aurantiochytrium limacinum, Strain ATCCMYA-1381" /LENGTH=252 /DNA_ID=CAMNT_0012035131 /DNA_START=621 /DNA_END=1379 /DNA_ORIENTATION=-
MGHRIFQAVAGALGGALLGICVSILVNHAMLEISVNGFFSAVFGCSLILMGLLILYRVNALSWQSGVETGRPAQKTMSTYFVMLFACLVVLAGLFCFMLEKDWFQGISPTLKVPMYMLLGVALWFALTFSIMDLFNFVGQYCVVKLSRGRRLWQPLVSTPIQISTVLFVAVMLGLFFGIVFGTLDVEDDLSKEHTLKAKEFHYTLPVGALACAIVGGINHACLRPPISSGVARDGLDEHYVPRGKAAFDDGI